MRRAEEKVKFRPRICRVPGAGRCWKPQVHVSVITRRPVRETHTPQVFYIGLVQS